MKSIFPSARIILKTSTLSFFGSSWDENSLFFFWFCLLVLAFFAPLLTRSVDVWEKDVSKACVVCSWETFELVAEQKVSHKTARGSHSSWPWKRNSESSQPTEGNITLEARKVKENLQHLNDCLGMWCKRQRTKWTNWMMWQWTNTLWALMPCLYLFNCCFLTVSHCVHEPGTLFLGWAFTRCSEKELGAGLLCGWGCDVEPGEITTGVWPQALKQVP